ncbi:MULTISPECIES: ABC1 kinase family protein [unclassified Arsukibacterium]|uniref:ABC1 kinase family protein n=1 Tax=unclassified Arsukibacterium TaxID=2635278 RepID=UPI000C452FEA|nr:MULTISPECIES: AarF/ABC1/UbiB kinase family protein [unclassified Arsukibacterium]MBM33323.1 ubiquinol-cytochrome C reductase [Rheinheimera sp.]HAW94125.1 ubiquinol-cytochrome C reductase [Candidatus Azambacteria bacterium]|tara:strand:- start:60956 stop:62302 length:1347 start_codon:yes stop_codon:yes gene_type:complete
MVNKTSEVPGNRIRRIGGLASLAGRVAGGMLAEGARQLAQGNRPSGKAMLLTPANIKRVADQLAHMRGAAMKMGQLLSMDSGDLLPAELTDLLARLRANANPMPAKQLSQVLRQNLGEQWQQHFADFTFKPIAAASIGQVHQAYHDNGDKLAVKIQYPGVRASIDSDVDNVATLLRLSGLIPPEMDYHGLLAEAKIQLKNEADYLKEATFLQRYRHYFADDDTYLLPKVYQDLTSANILIMSYVEGDTIESLLNTPQAERDRVLRLMFKLFFRELFEFKLVQTDPNFANYLYNADSQQLVLLDFGACRDYSDTISNGYRALFSAACSNNQPAMASALSTIGFFSQAILPEQKTAVLNLVELACEPLRQNAAFDFGQSDLARRLRDAGTALSTQQNYWHSPPADALFLHRKIAGLYLLAARLRARVNIWQLLEPYLTHSNTRQVATPHE